MQILVSERVHSDTTWQGLGDRSRCWLFGGRHRGWQEWIRLGMIKLILGSPDTSEAFLVFLEISFTVESWKGDVWDVRKNNRV